MKFTLPAASLLALALFAVPGMAQTQPEMLVAQSEEIPAEVKALLDDKRPLSELSVKELTQRIRTARGFVRGGGLPKDVQRQLQAMMKAARVERTSRQQAGAKPATDATGKQAAEEDMAEEDSAAQDTAETADPAVPETTAKPAQTAATDGVPEDVTAYLADNRDARQLSPADLRARFQMGRKLAQSQGLPKGMRRQIKDKMKADRVELRAKRPDKQAASGDQPAVGDQAATLSGNVEEMDDGTEQPGTIAVDEQDVGNLDKNQGNADAEARAKAILADTATASEMSDAELRQRLATIRDLMKGNKLSGETERLLRQKLAEDRRVLRTRVLAERRDGGEGGQENGQRDKNVDPNYMINIEIVLRDTRPSEQLSDRELRRRIQVYLNATADQRYQAAERERWRQIVERDRRFLRQRLVELRRERQASLRDRKADIELGIDLDAGQDYEVDAAEAADEDIEDVLVAAPRRKLDRRYSVEEIENSAELRDALPRVEIDTIRFGFNESFVREEEVENLDRVGEIIERVLSAHPREVFLIEGHTDAVGTDAYNLDLSRARASAVKQALSDYYVIPPENLRTAGYGERFLKIPTAEAEQENRRVSVSRATALVGELEE